MPHKPSSLLYIPSLPVAISSKLRDQATREGVLANKVLRRFRKPILSLRAHHSKDLAGAFRFDSDRLPVRRRHVMEVACSMNPTGTWGTFTEGSTLKHLDRRHMRTTRHRPKQVPADQATVVGHGWLTIA
jgi:hypothetical protein